MLQTFATKVQEFYRNAISPRGKVAAVEAIKNAVLRSPKKASARTVYDDGDRRAPKTPWGPAQEVVEVVPGVSWMYTAGHGGLRVSPSVARKRLTPAARKLADNWGGSFWYEEDIAYVIPLYENPTWGVILNQLTGGRQVSREELGDEIRTNFPAYFRMVEENYQLPAAPKVGDLLQIQKDIPYGGVRTVPAGVEAPIVEVKRSRVVFLYDRKRWSLSFDWMDRGYAQVIPKG